MKNLSTQIVCFSPVLKIACRSLRAPAWTLWICAFLGLGLAVCVREWSYVKVAFASVFILQLTIGYLAHNESTNADRLWDRENWLRRAGILPITIGTSRLISAILLIVSPIIMTVVSSYVHGVDVISAKQVIWIIGGCLILSLLFIVPSFVLTQRWQRNALLIFEICIVFIMLTSTADISLRFKPLGPFLPLVGMIILGGCLLLQKTRVRATLALLAGLTILVLLTLQIN